MVMNKPKANNNAAVLQDQFRAYSRSPFIEILARMTDCEPEQHRLQEFANQYPDRWASAIKTLANLAGFHDKLEVSGNITIELAQMGDAQLLDRLEEVKGKLLALDNQTIEGESQEEEGETIGSLALLPDQSTGDAQSLEDNQQTLPDREKEDV